MKNSATAKPRQTAEKFSIECRQILAADYLLFLPEGYGTSSKKRWPLLLFLHGAGERGSKLRLVARHGPPKLGTIGTNLPFIVVSPQCPKGKIWSNDLLLALLDDIESRYAVDTHRVYLTGLSMGGYGAWSLGLRHPERFAAIAPVCGGTSLIELHLTDKSKLRRLPVWVFHGAKDPVIPLEESERAVTRLKKLGVREVKFTVYPEARHDCWTATYANPELFSWFLRHAR